MKSNQKSKFRSKLKLLRSEPGVYLLKDRTGRIIYVGKAKSLKNRVKAHLNAPFAQNIYDLEVIICKSELESLLKENSLIKRYTPKYNVLLRDDKQYPYLKLTCEEWPRLIIVRKKIADGAKYFGRFTGSSARELVKIVKKIFPIRWCHDSPLRSRIQGCLYENISQCIAPCLTKKADKKMYMKICDGISSFLSGDFDKTIKKLETDMNVASENEQYEWAAVLRDKIKKLKILIKPSLNISLTKGEKFQADRGGLRIEAFDVANLTGTDNVASMVVFENGIPKKSDYRKFKLRLAKTPDDTASIFEVVKRRYSGSLKDKLPLPNLILVDGGIGQVGAAKKAVSNTIAKNIPVVGLAKKFENVFSSDSAYPRDLPTETLHLLQRVRDEAHRFATTYHKSRRKKRMIGK